MRNFKKMTILTISGMLVFALSLQSFTASDQARFTKEGLTGRDLFKAIYFNTGNLRNNLEVISEIMTEEEISETTTLKIDRIISQIDESNPNFFEVFQAEITSGDVNKIQETLLDGYKIISSIKESEYISQENHLIAIKINESSKKMDNNLVDTDLTFLTYIIMPGLPVFPYTDIVIPGSVATPTGNINSIVIEKNAFFTEKIAIQIAETFVK